MSGCDVLFRRYFVPWYQLPPGTQPPRIVRGDIEIFEGAEGQSVEEISILSDERKAKLSSRVSTMVSAANGDWASYLGVSTAVSLDSLHAFDQHWSRSQLAQLIRRSDPKDFTNDYLVICCELGAVIGEIMRSVLPDLEWLYESPYWESSLWHKATASRISTFHWAIKKMSAYGVNDGLRAKVLAGLDTLGKGH